VDSFFSALFPILFLRERRQELELIGFPLYPNPFTEISNLSNHIINSTTLEPVFLECINHVDTCANAVSTLQSKPQLLETLIPYSLQLKSGIKKSPAIAGLFLFTPNIPQRLFCDNLESLLFHIEVDNHNGNRG